MQGELSGGRNALPKRVGGVSERAVPWRARGKRVRAHRMQGHVRRQRLHEAVSLSTAGVKLLSDDDSLRCAREEGLLFRKSVSYKSQEDIIIINHHPPAEPREKQCY